MSLASSPEGGPSGSLLLDGASGSNEKPDAMGARRRRWCEGNRSQITGCGVKQAVESRFQSDAELLGAVRSDANAFAVFYDRYEAAIVGYLARRVRDPELVADLTAEVFAATAARRRATGRPSPRRRAGC
jgi:hypothetical protein